MAAEADGDCVSLEAYLPDVVSPHGSGEHNTVIDADLPLPDVARVQLILNGVMSRDFSLPVDPLPRRVPAHRIVRARTSDRNHAVIRRAVLVVELDHTGPVPPCLLQPLQSIISKTAGVSEQPTGVGHFPHRLGVERAPDGSHSMSLGGLLGVHEPGDLGAELLAFVERLDRLDLRPGSLADDPVAVESTWAAVLALPATHLKHGLETHVVSGVRVPVLQVPAVHEATVVARLDVAKLVVVGQDPPERVSLDGRRGLGEHLLPTDGTGNLLVSGRDLSIETIRVSPIVTTVPLPLELGDAPSSIVD
jgi:hypothetical protein